MDLKKFIAGNLTSSFDMLKATIADLSDADLMQRPCPGANHGNWQLGHLIAAEVHLMSAGGARMPELPAGFADRYTKQTAALDDASKFARKAELVSLFDKVRTATIESLKSVPESQFEAKGPMPFTPTVADLYEVMAGHISMHCGQIQVLRRKLGKPILF